MANLYNLEPQPTAKVVLNTTAGDLAIEIFAKQTPLAARNFLQHCLDGYYTNTIFHRLVSGFIVQGGDPTGTGSGGISALNSGEPFQDEFHSRLKFNRRGLLGMANEGKDSNGSQFFFTLDATPELQGKNTMFGRIEGDTIYNLMRMADVEMVEGEGSERPLYPIKVTGSEVLVNPFDDMVARVRDAPRSKGDEAKTEMKKRKKPAGKNVLSFGVEEGDEDGAPVVKKVKANPKLVAVDTEEPERSEKVRKKKVPRPREAETVEEDVVGVSKPSIQAPVAEESEDEEQEEEPEDRRQKALDKTNAEIQALKASMKRTVDAKPKETEKPKSALEAMIPTTSTRGRKRGKVTDERGAMDMFKAFKQQLETLPGETPQTNGTKNDPENKANSHSADSATAPEPDDEEAALCDLHFIANCQSCKSWDEEKPDGEADDGDDDPAWMAHTLTFAKDTLGKNLEWREKMKEIEVIDPREKARAIKEERKKGGKSKR